MRSVLIQIDDFAYELGFGGEPVQVNDEDLTYIDLTRPSSWAFSPQRLPYTDDLIEVWRITSQFILIEGLNFEMLVGNDQRIYLTLKPYFATHVSVSRLMGKPTMWFPNRSDTNRAVQAQDG